MVIQTDLENQDTLIMKTFMIGPKLSIMDSNRLRLIDGQTIFGINIRIIELLSYVLAQGSLASPLLLHC